MLQSAVITVPAPLPAAVRSCLQPLEASYTLGPDLHLDPRCFRTPDAQGPDLH